MRSDPAYALALAVIVAAIYLVVLRLVDLNEKEPLWALAVALLLGALAASVAGVTVDDSFRELDRWGEAITDEVAKVIALVAALAVLEAVGRVRGWSEVNGLVDGIVYGAAVGLGYATGEAFVREAAIGTAAIDTAQGAGGGSLLWTTLLHGLAQGVFGAILGAGFGLAVDARTPLRLVGAPVAALVAAVLFHVGYVAVGEAGSLDPGGAAQLRSWLVLLLPLALVAAAIAYALGRERTAIGDELADEAASGTVTEADLDLLLRPGARRARYAGRVARGDVAGWLELRAVHNRQVQLAMTERRLRDAHDEERRAGLQAEVDRLRVAILEHKRDAGLLDRARSTA